MRILTVCAEGINRSVAAKWLLQYRTIDGQHEHEALSVGINCTSEQTRQMLYDWADRIILLDARFAADIPTDKLVVWDVGEDRFFNGFHPELIDILREFGEATHWPVAVPI